MAQKMAANPHVVLPSYTLDSPLVLMPGILYNVSFPRFKAAAFLARYREKAGHVPVVQNVLSEYDFDTAGSEIPVLSPDAISGISAFHSADIRMSQIGSETPELHETPSDLDWLVVAVFPNIAKISPRADQGPVKTATVCRVVSVFDDSNTVKLTLQAVIRANQSSASVLRNTEKSFTLDWQQSTPRVKAAKVASFQASTNALFKSMNTFLDTYRSALSSADAKSDLLTLNPLANALFMQLAGSRDFDKAYATLQKICHSSTASASGRQLSRVVDLTVAIVPFPNTEKLRVLQARRLPERIELAAKLATKMAAVFEAVGANSALATRWFHDEASNMQKANLVANQLKSIRVVLEGLATKKGPGPDDQKQLVRRQNGSKNSVTRSAKVPGSQAGNSGFDAGDRSRGGDGEEDDDNDLRSITNFIRDQLPHISSISSDSKRLLVKDFRRIKNANPGNADFHVIRNYLEIVADLPWDKYVARFASNKDIDVSEARRQLDADHYGLQHVKTRLVQYLVVLKLLAANAEKEYKDSGMQQADENRRRQQEMERRKFTRESANGESIIMPGPDDPSPSKTGETGEKQGSQVPENARKTVGSGSHATALLASKHNRSPILMLAGPPGVGKTSLAKSIASTLGRNFQRISLGGVRDESEIRGHRRTYIGAMAGSIVQALRKAGAMNPVILLDEIDKVVGGNNSSNRAGGDPAAALLEVLDPEQNSQFVDHYLGFPIDLSQVIFICTANEPHALSRPLLDRLEMIEVGAYDYNEKLVIGRKYLLPRQMKRNGFADESRVEIPDDVMQKLILDYTREAGVRNLERSLGTVCRFKAVEYSESLVDSLRKYVSKVEEFDLPKYLGLPYPSLSNDIVELPVMASRYGVVNGLSYNTDGSGSVLVFESIGFEDKGQASLNMTGRLGEVLMESAKIGLTFIQNALDKRMLNIEDSASVLKKLNSTEIHMHVPSGAVQKDGPSAGITMALSFLSLILHKPVPSNIAMTGEITLRGLVLPIGGLKEKILGAHLTGQIEKIIVPRENRRDILEHYVHKLNDTSRLNGLLRDNANTVYKDQSPENYFAEKYGVRIVYAKEFWDVIRHVWGDELLANVENSRLDEYHL